MASDVNPDLFQYVSDNGKYRLEIASDGSVGLMVNPDNPDKARFTFFPYVMVKVLPPFNHGDLVNDPGDDNDYSGVAECPLACDGTAPSEPTLEPTPIEQFLANAEALERFNAALDRHLDLRSQLIVMTGMEQF